MLGDLLQLPLGIDYLPKVESRYLLSKKSDQVERIFLASMKDYSLP